MKQDWTHWYVYTAGPRPYGDAEISTTVGDMPVTVGFVCGKYASRIVAAVNATSALSTESLEAGIINRMIAALRDCHETVTYFEALTDDVEIGQFITDTRAILAEIGVE
jgi:hypothetical protein